MLQLEARVAAGTMPAEVGQPACVISWLEHQTCYPQTTGSAALRARRMSAGKTLREDMGVRWTLVWYNPIPQTGQIALCAPSLFWIIMSHAAHLNGLWPCIDRIVNNELVKVLKCQRTFDFVSFFFLLLGEHFKGTSHNGSADCQQYGHKIMPTPGKWSVKVHL